MNEKILQNTKQYNTVILLTIIVLMGTYLRLIGLVDQSYWLDELYSADFSNPSRSFSSMLLVTLDDVHPPLYQSLLWLLYKAFGYSELVGKAFSVTTGILSIIAIYYLGKELFSKYIGLIAAFLLAINYFAIYYSLETRSYAMLMLLSIVSYIYFIKVLKYPAKSAVLLYWVSTIVLLYTHYFGFFLVATQATIFLTYLVLFRNRRKELFKLAVYTSLIFIISLMPIAPFIIKNAGFNAWWLGTPSPFFFVKYIFSYFHFMPITLLLGLSFIVSLWYISRSSTTKTDRIGLVILIIWIVIGYLLPYLRSVLSAPLITNRNTIIVLPAILLFASYAIWHFPRILKLVLLLLVFFLSIYIIYPYYSIPVKGQYREVLMSIQKYRHLPTYHAIPYGETIVNGEDIGTNHYQTYADMLNLDIKIHTRKQLQENLKTGKSQDCLLVLDAHGDHIKDLNITLEGKYRMINEVKKYGAKAVLFSKSANPDSCLNASELN